jgi:hypothetical protein
MMDGFSFGRKLVLDSRLEVGVNYRMDGRGLKSILCILLVVCASCVRFDLPADSSVNSIAWAPYDLGPILACASSDGKISVLSFQSKLPEQFDTIES